MAQELSVKQYAKKMGVSKAAIFYRLKEKKPLPGVTGYRMSFDRFLLFYDEKTKLAEARLMFRTRN